MKKIYSLKGHDERLGPFTISQWPYEIAILVLAYFVYKSGLDALLKRFCYILLVALAIGFTIPQFEESFRGFVHLVWSKRPGSYNRLRNIFAINSISGNAIRLPNGNLVGILKVKPVIFSVLSETKKEGLISKFKSLINNLDFPIEILMVTGNLVVSLNRYFDQLHSRVTALGCKGLGNALRDYEALFKEYISVNLGIEKRFYIAVSARGFSYSNDEKAKDGATSKYRSAVVELNERVRILEKGLRDMGLGFRRLNDEELVSLIAEFYRVDWNIQGGD